MTTNPRLPSAKQVVPILGAALLVLPGCNGLDPPERETVQEVVAPNQETFVTDAPGIDKFKGFNEVYDVVLDSCLRRCNDEDNAPRVHSDESALSISFVSSASDVASNQTFTLDANVEMALYVGNLDVNASMRLANRTNFSRNAVRMLVVAHRWFKVAHNEQVQIDPKIVSPDLLRRSQAASDADFDDRLTQFIGRCGHVYIKEQLQGAYLFALYEFTSTDSSRLSGLEARLGAAFRSHVGRIGGGVQATAQTELNEALRNVQWTVQVAARGFRVNGRDGGGEGRIALEQNGRGGLDLQRIVGFFDAMQTSVGEDMQAIQTGDDTHAQSVFPLGLIAGYYPLLLRDVPATEVTRARSRMSDIQDAHDRMMQAYGGLASALIKGRDEVNQFLALSPDVQARHQVMKWSDRPFTPAQKLRDGGAGLLDRVEPFRVSLDPRAGAGAARDFARRILDCWRWGRSGDLGRCLPDVNRPVEAATGHATFVAALNRLSAYNDTARPVWLSYWLRWNPNSYPRAEVSCDSGYHLPTEVESNAMGLIAWHRIPTFFPGKKSFWLDRVTPECVRQVGAVAESRLWDENGRYWFFCAAATRREPTACVDDNGLFPTSVPRLYPTGGF
jgi:hypothetical protein